MRLESVPGQTTALAVSVSLGDEQGEQILKRVGDHAGPDRSGADVQQGEEETVDEYDNKARQPLISVAGAELVHQPPVRAQQEARLRPPPDTGLEILSSAGYDSSSSSGRPLMIRATGMSTQ